MTLRFPYQSVKLFGPPPPSLSPIATERWRPLVPIRIVGPSSFMDFDGAVLDTGSDDTLFSLPDAERIGAILLPQAGAHIYRGRTYSIEYSYVQLELTDGSVLWSWPAIVGFSEAKFRFPLLGQAGCLEFTEVTFRGKERVTVLETNASYPGQVI